LTQLRQKLQEGREASLFLSQHVNDLFTQDNFASHHGQGHQEHLAEGCRLAEHLAHRLCPGEEATDPVSTELLLSAQLTQDSTGQAIFSWIAYLHLIWSLNRAGLSQFEERRNALFTGQELTTPPVLLGEPWHLHSRQHLPATPEKGGYDRQKLVRLKRLWAKNGSFPGILTLKYRG
jgi:hypothetical protein